MIFYCVFLLCVGVLHIRSETETGKKVEELGEYLVDLDKRILRMIILPKSGKGDALLKNLENFWKNFRYLDGLIVLNEQKAFRPAKYVLEKECPSFVEEAFDVLNLQQTYKWNSGRFATFKEYLLLIARLSQKFQLDFSQMKIDVDTLFDQPYNDKNNNQY